MLTKQGVAVNILGTAAKKMELLAALHHAV